MKAIIDLVLLGILIICIWSGYKKGLLMGIGGIVCIIVAIYGGNLLANLFSYDVVPALKPFVAAYADSLVTDEEGGIREQLGWSSSDYSVDDLLSENPEQREAFSAACYASVGVDETSAALMAERAVAYAQERGVGMQAATVQILTETLSYICCFILAFLIIIILLTVIGNLPNLSYKIPNLDLVNDIGGAVLGLVTGLMFCVLLVWALKFMGMLIGTDTLSSTRLGGLLLRKNFLLKYLNI